MLGIFINFGWCGAVCGLVQATCSILLRAVAFALGKRVTDEAVRVFLNSNVKITKKGRDSTQLMTASIYRGQDRAQEAITRVLVRLTLVSQII